jgi:hypothetical protein
MSRKLLVYRNPENQERVRVYFVDGVCQTPQNLQMVFDNSQFSWEAVKHTGVTFVEARSMRRRKSPKMNPDIPEFLGLQVAEKPVKEIVMDETGQPVVSKRGKKSSVTPELIASIKRLAEEGKTVKQAEAELGMPYPTIVYNAKKNGIVFIKGRKGHAKGEVKPIDLVLLEGMKRVASEGKTLKQAEMELSTPYATLFYLAKKEGLVFKAGVKGRPKKVEVLPVAA